RRASMHIRFPDAHSIFRVAPAKVPGSDERAQCSVCSALITIPTPTGQTPSGGNARTATPTAPLERPRTAPSAQGGWDSPPYGSARQNPPAAPTQRPAAAPPPARASEVGPAPRTGREQPIDRGPVTATATPPSPASSRPEFT